MLRGDAANPVCGWLAAETKLQLQLVGCAEILAVHRVTELDSDALITVKLHDVAVPRGDCSSVALLPGVVGVADVLHAPGRPSSRGEQERTPGLRCPPNLKPA